MSTSDTLGTIEDRFQQSLSRSLKPEAVASQVLLMSAISLGTVVVFSALRPSNRIVYEPKSKYHAADKEPPRMSKSFFGWLSPLINVKEPELVDKIGLDATTFLRFLRMMRWLMTVVALVGAVALMPADAIYTTKHNSSVPHDLLSILTIRDVNGRLLYLHVGMSYVITAAVCAFLWTHWAAMVRLRRAWFRSPEVAAQFYARTLQVTQVPKKNQSDEGVAKIFASVHMPYQTTSVRIGRRVGALPELIEYHNATVRELEKYLVRYLKGNKIGKKRPTIRLGGFLGMGGRVVDAIDYYTDRLRVSEAKVNEFRNKIDDRKAENYGFASMAAVPYAHVVAHTLHSKRVMGAHVELAPNPKDIIWANMTLSDGAISRKRLMGFLWMGLVGFFYTIPLSLISFLANLAAFSDQVPFLKTWSGRYPQTFNVVSGILPPAVSALFGWVLPKIMRSLSKYQGGKTHSRLDRAVVARYFAFLVISQLIIFTVIGVAFQIVTAIINSVDKHESFGDIVKEIRGLNVLGSLYGAYVSQSSYWLTFFPLRGFLAVFDLAQIINLVLIWAKTRLFGRTPRDHRDWTQPPDFEYAVYYANMLFMGCVGLVFAPLAPLVTVAAAAVFWISSWVYKYQLMFVFVSQVETGGRMWNVVTNRVMFSTVLMQSLLIVTLGLQFGWRSLQWISAVPPIFAIFVFKAVLDRRFQRSFRYYLPTEQELAEAAARAPRTHERSHALSSRFGHPALHAELWTPMVHANQIPLLSQVYAGKISAARTKVKEMGGQKVEAAVVANAGITFAGIEKSDLEYDAAMYQRDRGDQDWDAKSTMSDAMSLAPAKSYGGDGGAGAPPLPQLMPGYNQYLAQGPRTPGGTSPAVGNDDYELARFDTRTTDQQPLLAAAQYPGMASTASLPAYPGVAGGGDLGDGYREAPLHRPYPPSRDPSGYPPTNYPPSNYAHSQYASSQYAPSPAEEHPPNMAGRGLGGFHR